jgi:DnaJ like chaperone protein
VRRGASPEEIKSAYREMLSKYHPDKVSHLGEDFQKIAHEKAVDIQKAYEALGGKG